MTDNKLAVRESTELTQFSGPVEGLENMTQADLALANYGIIQPVSKGEKGRGPQGFFYDSLTGRVTEVVLAVLLRMTPCRTLWKSRTERMPECSSYDGQSGSEYGRCAQCGWNKWSKDKEEKTCKAGYLLLCANTEDGDSIFMTRAMGMSVKPAKTFYTQLVGQAQKLRLPAFGFLVKLEAQLHEEETKFYTLLPMVIEPLQPERIEHYRELYQMLGGVNIKEGEPASSTTTPDEEDF